MSLILEALRKSEAERRRGLAPDVAMELPPTPISRPRGLSAWLLPALVVAILLVLAGWWSKREPSTTESPAATGAITDAPRDQDTPGPALSPRIESRPAAPALASAPTPAMRAPAIPMPAPVAAPAPKPASAIAARPIQPVPLPPAPARPLPLPAADISDDASMLPPIKLSMHMWDDVPSKRFVILNSQRMTEGDRYGGITVVAIERNGVVVESNGIKARVPLP